MRERDYNSFLNQYQKLEPALKDSRIMSLMAVQAASLSGNDPRYRQTLAHLAKHHGRDASLTFVLMDHYFLAAEYDEVLASIARFREHLGVEDPALFAMEANVYLMTERSKEGIARASRAMQLEPELEVPYWSLLWGYSVTGQYEAAVRALQTLERDFYYTFDPGAFEGEAIYAGLVESDAFRKWSLQDAAASADPGA